MAACWLHKISMMMQVGYGKRAYQATTDLVKRWGHMQLPWAQVNPATAIKPGGAVCISANVFGLWTAVPLQIR